MLGSFIKAVGCCQQAHQGGSEGLSERTSWRLVMQVFLRHQLHLLFTACYEVVEKRESQAMSAVLHRKFHNMR